ncbi:hypothetical protein BCON_0083g00380 [Botryotinia convoluta]|uniref:Uncharacterized protein n=1 Tax=Botryotinia convoluta TaxID=54673 RepID=A0A4Z1I406_9HELO|nr:hypothetical protein BCON_0083g00380 [Botryotinia convoluta]
MTPTSMNWDEWDETVISGPNISELYSTVESSTSTYASPRSTTSSSEIDWGTWVTFCDPCSPDATFIIDSNISEHDLNLNDLGTGFPSKPLHREMELSPLPNITNVASTTACSKQSGGLIEKIVFNQEPTDEIKREQIENEVRKMQRDLQNGLLNRHKPAGENIMNDMSASLFVLETLKPSAISISATGIPELLGAILRLNEVPRDKELRFKERTQTLLDIFNLTLKTDQLKKNLGGVSPTPKALTMEIAYEKEIQHKMNTSSSPRPLVLDLTKTDDESETSHQVNVHALNVGVRRSKTRKRKSSDTFSSSSVAKISPRQSKRMKTVQNYMPQENIWICTALKWIENIVEKSDEDTIQVKRIELLRFKDELDAWRLEDLNVTRELELL